MMSPLDEALASRRAERMLHEFGLDMMVIEGIWRERKPADDKSDIHLFNRIERQGLMTLATRFMEAPVEP